LVGLFCRRYRVDIGSSMTFGTGQGHMSSRTQESVVPLSTVDMR
jgi:hypothetical protein